jgi:hypothetical protein
MGLMISGLVLDYDHICCLLELFVSRAVSLFVVTVRR